MERCKNLGWDTIAKPLAHHGEAVGVAECTNDGGCVAMSLLIGGEVWRVGQCLFDVGDGGLWRLVGRVDVCESFGEAFTQPERSFGGGLRFDECV